MLNDLGGIGDVMIELEERGDVSAAERLGRRFAEDLRLLDDLGSGPDEERDAFPLTMAGGEMAKLLASAVKPRCLPTDCGRSGVHAKRTRRPRP